MWDLCVKNPFRKKASYLYTAVKMNSKLHSDILLIYYRSMCGHFYTQNWLFVHVGSCRLALHHDVELQDFCSSLKEKTKETTS